MIQENRTRERIYYRPTFHLVFVYGRSLMIMAQFKAFRQKFKQFDAFLIELNKCLKATNDEAFINIEKLIDGDVDAAYWIYSTDTMLDVLIKLYNLCLSPKQAYEYINECKELYKDLLFFNFGLCGTVETSYIHCKYDDKPSKCSRFSVIQIKKPDYHVLDDQLIAFNIETQLRTVRMKFLSNDISYHGIHLKIHSDSEKAEDMLRLFENYQDNKGLSKYLYFTGMQQLEKKGIIREVSHELDEFKTMEYNYETDLEIGQKYDV